jgi:hypothetical protein
MAAQSTSNAGKKQLHQPSFLEKVEILTSEMVDLQNDD